MGGGDLNLKKSWHPQTLRNVEKVWKAEQKAEAESKKIDQLRKELEEERAREQMQRHAVEQGIAKKKGERLDWMYAAAAGGQVDHELYLLGKPVDKAVDPMAQGDEEDVSAPGASFMNDTGANTPNDLAAKVRDDPLFLIKRKEEEKRKELLNNPVKMKQLKLMLQANLDKSSKKKKDKKKKSKKEEKKRRKERGAELSDESEDDEREITKERKKLKKAKYQGRREDSEDDMRDVKESKKARKERHAHRSDESDDDVRGKVREHSNRRKERHRENDVSEDDLRGMKKESRKKRHMEEGKEMWNGNHRDHYHESRRSRVEEDERRPHHRNGEHYSNRHRSPDRKRPQIRSRSRSPIRRRDRERGEERRQRQNSSCSPPRDKRHKSRSPSHSPPRKSRKLPSPDRLKAWEKGGCAVTKQMDAAAKEKRLAAMMENAKWRDEQRGKNVKRYEDEDAKLEAKEALDTDKSAAFLNDIKIQSFSSKTTSSVSDRIRRNINSVQRTPAALESFLGK